MSSLFFSEREKILGVAQKSSLESRKGGEKGRKSEASSTTAAEWVDGNLIASEALASLPAAAKSLIIIVVDVDVDKRSEKKPLRQLSISYGFRDFFTYETTPPFCFFCKTSLFPEKMSKARCSTFIIRTSMHRNRISERGLEKNHSNVLFNKCLFPICDKSELFR